MMIVVMMMMMVKMLMILVLNDDDANGDERYAMVGLEKPVTHLLRICSELHFFMFRHTMPCLVDLV